MADLEGVQGVRSNPPLEPDYFHGEFKEILSKVKLTNPPFLHLNPFLKNPGSAPGHSGWGTVNRERKLRKILGCPKAVYCRINKLFVWK